MRFDVLTLFPEMFEPIQQSILGRASKNHILEFNFVNMRDFSKNKHLKVDDTPYGGGGGMVIMCEPVFKAIESVKKENSKVILMAPTGKSYNQSIAYELSKEEHLIILCGHYEGFDERIKTLIDMEISIGDYVLTGGELPASVVADSVIRLIPGVISEESLKSESFTDGLLDYPVYTKPRVYRDMYVPDVLLSGDHKRIEEYRMNERIRVTKEKRPDILNWGDVICIMLKEKLSVLNV